LGADGELRLVFSIQYDLHSETALRCAGRRRVEYGEIAASPTTPV
jgi:hypothetical protein